MLAQLISVEFYVVILTFCRVGAVFLTMPTVGETFISPRIRLTLALLVSVVMAPVVGGQIPALPDQFTVFMLLIGTEILTGLFMGAIMRIMVSALATAGTILAFLTGFSNALLFNPLLSDQGALQSVFLSMLGLMLILVTDTHHLMFMAIADSYQLFTAGSLPLVGDMADTIARLVADSFLLGMQLASPFIVVAVVYNVALGLLARLMPTLQIFFIAMPLQIILGIIVLATVVSAMMLWFLTNFADKLSNLLIIG